ncbi:unknown [Eggerthella sp. CAG:1427]|nr:unknown [Eggerthella sp. CAG:1427]
MVISNEEKKHTAIPYVLVAVIAPILASLVIPLYSSLVSESVRCFQTPFLDIAEQNQVLGVALNFLYVASPTVLFSLVLAASIVVLLKAPKQSQLAVCIIAFVISLVILVYATAVIFDPSLRMIGELEFSYGSDFPLIACFVYGALLVYAGMTRKAD